MNQEELSARLRAMFVEELADQLGEANRHLLALERNPANGDELRSLFRVMHTLKGAARSANVLEIERVCHRLESMLAAARDAGRALTRAELDALFAGVDQLIADGTALGGATMPTREISPDSVAAESESTEGET
ncbi:MAG TPA: Hpt domain-containing protein, partial [Gemmatimonadaceae bacterium]